MDLGFAAKGGIMSLALRDQMAMFNAYMPFVKGGGLFVETTKQFALGDEVFLLVEFMDQPEPIPVAASVIWVTPRGSTTYKPGIGIQLTEENRDLMNSIETQVAEMLKSTKPTFTM